MTTAKNRQPVGRGTSVQGRRTPHNEPISTVGVDFAAQPSVVSVNPPLPQAESAQAAPTAVKGPTASGGLSDPWTRNMLTDKNIKTNHNRPDTPNPASVKPRPSSPQLMGNYLATSGDSCWPLTVVLPDGVVIASEQGVPQGGPLSPLLSNIVLDELDCELDRRGHRFVRYADDAKLYVSSERAGRRVMVSLTEFIERRLRLKVKRPSRLSLARRIATSSGSGCD